ARKARSRLVAACPRILRRQRLPRRSSRRASSASSSCRSTAPPRASPRRRPSRRRWPSRRCRRPRSLGRRPCSSSAPAAARTAPSTQSSRRGSPIWAKRSGQPRRSWRRRRRRRRSARSRRRRLPSCRLSGTRRPRSETRPTLRWRRAAVDCGDPRGTASTSPLAASGAPGRPLSRLSRRTCRRRSLPRSRGRSSSRTHRSAPAAAAASARRRAAAAAGKAARPPPRKGDGDCALKPFSQPLPRRVQLNLKLELLGS
ncbi:hypothetical protein EMIHUDRAFT_437121, partial [Emiliania huxleyi CCMP1516]|uniref:Uncharacterized protein n=2 Tax=Emiliania huxleyi TaxID=2903 RepID=A0A0D3IQM6_EMIH1